MTKRNEPCPCPCGSGKKFKKCCYHTQNNGAKALNQEFNQELKGVLQGQDFDSLDDVQGLVDNYINERSNQGIAAFHGLSPDDMHQLLYQPNVFGDYFIDAFPYLLLEIEDSYTSPEDSIKRCYSSWVFERFAQFFGLADIQYTANERGYLSETEVKATPLLKLFVQFRK